MPLTPDELAALAPEAIRVADALIAAFRRDADGRVHLTKEERRRIGKLARDFGLHLLRDAID